MKINIQLNQWSERRYTRACQFTVQPTLNDLDIPTAQVGLLSINQNRTSPAYLRNEDDRLRVNPITGGS